MTTLAAATKYQGDCSVRGHPRLSQSDASVAEPTQPNVGNGEVENKTEACRLLKDCR